ncbi:MAG TPA: D-2-hydroxyacid dehydrogenase [Sphaerochaeta sp.]|nr:D-2-hydroxyacid dehydrogenase [Sphaerochaeta sp.]HPY45089.1 D-2-hydroxyacid dehydrogenase [Sphaerochaeta sp.]HQB04931.1 D-2-hydroxyacid dehydrogenase [Sphaerochaeta sp.]
MRKIVVLDGYALNPGDLDWTPLEAYGELTVYDRTEPKDVVKRIGDAEIIFTNKTILTGETIIQAPKLKYIGVLATGYNVLDMGAAREKGIVVTNIPAYSTDAVAQFTFALLLEITNRVQRHSDAVIRDNRWTTCKDFCFWDYPLIELANKKMGIIGYGAIGKAVGKVAKALNMEVLAYSPSLDPKHPDRASMETIYKESDIISLHLPLTEQSRGMINRETIAGMKDGVIILNTGRGPLINEQDLADALNSGKVYAAAVDVVSVEPIKADNPLLKAKNIIITPHIAWAPLQTRERLLGIAIRNVEHFLAGKPINRVDL